MSNARKADARQKRGGGLTMVSLDRLDFREAERELRLQASNAVDDFDAYLHREWLRSLFGCADARAAATRARRAAVSTASRCSKRTIWPATIATVRRTRTSRAGTDSATTDVTNELAAARREFRRLVIEALREQCASDEEFEAELRALTG